MPPLTYVVQATDHVTHQENYYTWHADDPGHAYRKHMYRYPEHEVTGVFTKFKVTGKLAYTKRNFPAIHTTDFQTVLGINLWRGTKWGWDVSKGKWCKLWEVYN